jgi:hypothetical protein
MVMSLNSVATGKQARLHCRQRPGHDAQIGHYAPATAMSDGIGDRWPNAPRISHHVHPIDPVHLCPFTGRRGSKRWGIPIRSGRKQRRWVFDHPQLGHAGARDILKHKAPSTFYEVALRSYRGGQPPNADLLPEGGLFTPPSMPPSWLLDRPADPCGLPSSSTWGPDGWIPGLERQVKGCPA